jgi:hypothetical protein
MKIGFYGSSFCHVVSNKHSERYYYFSYIEKLRNHYNAEICHLGVSGCGVWDIMIHQFQELLEDMPDVAVFTWPSNGTVFHRTHRYIHRGATVPGSRIHKEDPVIWQAVCGYFDSLFDYDKDVLELKSALLYFDTVLLPQIRDRVKIIHLWEYGIAVNGEKTLALDLSNSNFIRDIKYPIKWTNGVEIVSPLMAVSVAGQWPRRANMFKILSNDPRCNHLDGDIKNDLLYRWISNAIDNYTNDVTIDKVEETVVFYDSFKG